MPVGLAATIILLAGTSSADVASNQVEIIPRTLTTQHSPTEPFEIALAVRNGSTGTISVKNITVDYPSALVAAGLTPRMTLTDAKGTAQPVPQSKANVEKDVQSSETLAWVVTVELRRPQLTVEDMKWLFVPSGDYTFPVVVAYKDESGKEADAEKDLTVSFQTPFSVLIAGALVGALLIGVLRTWTILLGIYKSGRLTSGVCFRLILALAGLQLPVSLLVALLAIIFAKISTDFRGVLRIELNDFWAGLLVGVLAQSTTGPIAEALGQVVGGVEPGQGPEGGPVAETLSVVPGKTKSGQTTAVS